MTSRVCLTQSCESLTTTTSLLISYLVPLLLLFSFLFFFLPLSSFFFDYLVHTIRKAITQEVADTGAPTTLFRTNTSTTKLMSAHSRVALYPLLSPLIPLIKEIMANPDGFEVYSPLSPLFPLSFPSLSPLFLLSFSSTLSSLLLSPLFLFFFFYTSFIPL